MELIEKHASFGGWQNVYRHYSQSLKCEMNVGVYLPPKAASEKLPVLYWLSGLTCNEQNFITKSGMQRYAAEHNIIVVAPDTSPRGSHVADADRYDLGQGAGFYLNATQAPWNEHYKMYDYIRNELPDLVMQHFPATTRKSISGHSMGGLGALETLLEDVSAAAYDKAVEVVTDVVRTETRKEDMRMIEDTKKWVLSPERKAPQATREYAAHRLDTVLDKFLKTMQTTAARLQEKLLKPEVRQKGKEQVKEKARDSVLQLLSRLQAEQAQRNPSVLSTAEKSENRFQ